MRVGRIRLAKLPYCVYVKYLYHSSRRRITVMKESVQRVIDQIRPMLQRDGGDVELVGVNGGVVQVRLRGACKGCPMSQMTLKNGIEKFLKQQVPEVDRVESVE
jgi:Fe-S cluster biogenesis protein NfuA